MNITKFWVGTVSLLLAFSANALPLTISTGGLGQAQISIQAEVNSLSRNFFLDTGSYITVIKPDQQALTLPKVGSEKTTGVSGAVSECDLVQATRFSLGPISFSNRQLVRCEDGMVDILGMDILDGRVWKLDFLKAQISEFAKPTTLQVEPIHRLYLGLPGIDMVIGGSKHLALFDTGAQLVSVDRNFVASHSSLFQPLGTSRARDSKGKELGAELYLAKEISLGLYDFENVVVVAIDFEDIKKHFGQDMQFIIGGNVIRRVNWMIDFKSNAWAILP